MIRNLFSDAVSALMDIALVGTVVFALAAAAIIIVSIALLDVFFTLLGYLWMPTLFIIALYALARHKGRWFIATLYPALTGLILWAYHWPTYADIGLPIIEAVLWFALSIPLMGRRDARVAAEAARLEARRLQEQAERDAREAQYIAAHTAPPAPAVVDVYSSRNDFV